jgi:hypothetical protein
MRLGSGHLDGLDSQLEGAPRESALARVVTIGVLPLCFPEQNCLRRSVTRS